MPLILILLLAVLIASFGFWDTLAAVLGGIGIILLVTFVLLLLIAATVAWIIRRNRRRLPWTR